MIWLAWRNNEKSEALQMVTQGQLTDEVSQPGQPTNGVGQPGQPGQPANGASQPGQPASKPAIKASQKSRPAIYGQPLFNQGTETNCDIYFSV